MNTAPNYYVSPAPKPNHRRPSARVLSEDTETVQTILAIERQINGGQRLSPKQEPKDTP